MPQPEPTAPPGEPLGRDAELAALRTFLDGAGGAPVVATVEGDAGMGKSTLVRWTLDTARGRGWTVLSARPAETEVSLSWVVVSDLLGPVFDRVANALPEPQARALEAVLLRTEAGPTEPRLVATAIVSVLGALAIAGPVMIAIDDVQWVDPDSAAALAFAVRRLPDRCALIVAERSPAGTASVLGLERAVPAERLVRIRPAGLSLAAIHHLVTRETGRAPARPRLSEIARVSGGNPFLVRELTRSSGWDDPGDAPGGRVPPSLRDLVAARIRELDEAARDTVGVAALMAGPSLAVLARAIERDPRPSLDEAERRGILTVRGDRIDFSHPLIAEAAAAGLAAARRREAHAALAVHALAIEDRGRHLAESTDEPDESIASTIEAAARTMLERGAPSAAGRLFGVAAQLTPPDRGVELARRATDAAAALLAAGDVLRADEAAASARAWAEAAGDGTRRVAAAVVAAEVAWVRGELRRAHDILEGAVTSAGSPAAVAELESRLAGFTLPLDAADAVGHAESAARALGPEAPPATLGYLRISQFLGEVLSGRPPRADLLESGLALERAAGDAATLSSVPLIWFNAIDDAERARARHRQEDAWYESRGEDGWRAERLGQRALTEFRAGDWMTAIDLAERACETLELEEVRPAWWTPFAWRSLIDAYRGRFDRADATLVALVDAARHQENRQWQGLTSSALGILRFLARDPAAANEAFVDARAAFDAIGHVEPIGDRGDPLHIEALLALGALDRARSVLERLERRAARLPRPWTSLAVPRARALVMAAGGDPAAALAVLDATDGDLLSRFAFDAAWNHLVRGQVLRRLNRKLDAAASLREAVAGFERFGAEPWAERARTELKRVGLRRIAPDELTPSERRIAELVAAGLRNREIASAAFVSEKTVEANLARIYRKLDVRSRAELAARLTTGAGGGVSGDGGGERLET